VIALPQALWSLRLFRYFVAGSVNTGVSQLVYLVGLHVGMAPGVAFACGFAVGVGLGYVLHSRIVFRAKPRHAHWVSFPAACVARLALSEWLLYALIDRGVTAGWAGLAVTVVMVPVGYALTKLALVPAAWRRA
jgi:putative flippase GtrA